MAYEDFPAKIFVQLADDSNRSAAIPRIVSPIANLRIEDVVLNGSEPTEVAEYVLNNSFRVKRTVQVIED